ncbi:MAG: hypothetical protein ACI87E_000189 [Mariniblastus sp.]
MKPTTAFNPAGFRPLCLAAILLAGIFTGCGESNRAKIVGTWKIDQADTLTRRMDRSSGSDDALESQAESEEDDSAKMLIQFLGSGELRTATNIGNMNVAKEGQWIFNSFDESANCMQVSCTLKGETTNHEIEFLDESSIKLIPPNMAGTKMKLKFKKQN